MYWIYIYTVYIYYPRVNYNIYGCISYEQWWSSTSMSVYPWVYVHVIYVIPFKIYIHVHIYIYRYNNIKCIYIYVTALYIIYSIHIYIYRIHMNPIPTISTQPVLRTVSPTWAASVSSVSSRSAFVSERGDFSLP